MVNKISRGLWHAVWNPRRRWWEIQNGRRDVIAVCYTGKTDACRIEKTLSVITSLKHMVAIVRMHEGELRASERAKLADAVALISEVA